MTVEDGTYDGDITIKKGDGQTLKDDLTLYILASGSYTAAEEGKTITKETITAGAAGGAKVGGNINIDGINVVLAGLYYSLDSKINVKISHSQERQSRMEQWRHSAVMPEMTPTRSI